MIARHETHLDKTDIWSALSAPLPPGVISWRQDGRPISRDGRHIATATQRWCGEGQSILLTADPYQSCLTLLDDHFRVLGCSARLQPGMRGAEGRVTRERQFGAYGEDADPVVRPLVGRRGQISRLAEIGPSGEVRHLLSCQMVGVMDHSYRIAEHQLIGEHIHLSESAHGTSLAASALRATQ